MTVPTASPARNALKARPERQMRAGRHAQPPAVGAERETRSLQRENDGQPPADALDAVEDFTDACAPEDLGKKREARDGVEGRRDAGAGGRSRHTWAGFDLFQRFLNERLVVFLRHLSTQDLRCDGDRKIDRFVADLLDGARRLQLDLLLGVLDDRRRLAARLLLQLLAQSLRVGAAACNDGFGFARAAAIIWADSRCRRSSSCRARWASSSDCAIVACLVRAPPAAAATRTAPAAPPARGTSGSSR